MRFQSILMPLLFCSLVSPAVFGEGPVEAHKPKAKAPAPRRAFARRARLRKPRAYFDAIRELSDVSSATRLLRVPVVQQDLKINKTKSREVSRALRNLSRKHFDVFMKLQALPNDSASGRFRRVVADFKADSQSMLVSVLTIEQRKRLKQLQLQKGGIEAFSAAQVVKRLKIDAKQQEKLDRLQRESVDADWRIIKRHYLGGISGMMKGVEDFDMNRKAYIQKALKVLTKSQREEYRELVGKPVDFYPRTTRPGDPST